MQKKELRNMGANIKTVIFDIDNTLYDFAEANKKALEAVADYTGEQFSWTHEQFHSFHREVQFEIYERLNYNGSCRSRLLRFQEMLERSDLPLSGHALRMYHIYWDTLIGAITPFEGASDTLRILKERGYRIGAGTDMTTYMQLKKLEKLELLPYFDFIVTSEEVGEEKPSGKIFEMCCAKGRCLPEECLFVGDHPQKDVQGALAAGMKALWFHPQTEALQPEAAGEKETPPIDEISSLRQVLSFLPMGRD